MIKRYMQVDASFLTRLQETFQYDPNNGRLRWRKAPCNRVRVGAIVGRTHENGHIEVRFDNRLFMAHHLVWALHYGQLPDRALQHVNGNKADNRINNLRRAA